MPSDSALPSWLALEQLTPFDAYAQAMGTALRVVALLQWVCSFYGAARALRILALPYRALPRSMADFQMGCYAAVPALIVGMMMLAVSLIRARRRSELELQRRVAAEESLRQVNNTLEERVAARTHARASELHDLVAGLESFNRNVSTTCAIRWPASAAWRRWAPRRWSATTGHACGCPSTPSAARPSR